MAGASGEEDGWGEERVEWVREAAHTLMRGEDQADRSQALLRVYFELVTMTSMVRGYGSMLANEASSPQFDEETRARLTERFKQSCDSLNEIVAALAPHQWR